MKKRILALVLCLAMLTTALCINAFAAAPAKIGGTYTVENGVLTLSVTISSNPGINTLVFDLDYNKDALSLKSITNGNVFCEATRGSMFEVNREACPLRFYFDENSIGNITANGTLVTLEFDVKKNADFGFSISVSNDDTYAGGEGVVPVDVEVTATEITEFVGIVGDINGDGKLNAKDSALIRKYITGSLTPTPAQMKLIDINSDGKINAKDSSLLKRLIVGGK